MIETTEIPNYTDYINAAQHSKAVAEDYMRQFDKEDFEVHLYEGAYFDCIVNIMTRYMKELSAEELALLDDYMQSFLNKKIWHTSDSAIIYNYVTNNHKDNVMIQPLIGKLVHAKDRFSFMLLIVKHELGYDFFYGLMTFILKDISDLERSNLQRYIRDFNSFNSNKEALDIIEKLKRDFNEL